MCRCCKATNISRCYCYQPVLSFRFHLEKSHILDENKNGNFNNSLWKTWNFEWFVQSWKLFESICGTNSDFILFIAINWQNFLTFCSLSGFQFSHEISWKYPVLLRKLLPVSNPEHARLSLSENFDYAKKAWPAIISTNNIKCNQNVLIKSDRS